MQTQYTRKDNYGTFYYSDKKMTRLHRLDGPACEYSDGSKYWYVDGNLHRLDGPAIEWADGTKYWYVDSNLHRLDGPAVEYPSGTKYWFVDGKLHRLDGPAIEYADGTKEWFIDNQLLTEDLFNKRTKLNSTIEINGRRFTVEELNRLIESAK